jgi:hypothetical protein
MASSPVMLGKRKMAGRHASPSAPPGFFGVVKATMAAGMVKKRKCPSEPITLFEGV